MVDKPLPLFDMLSQPSGGALRDAALDLLEQHRTEWLEAARLVAWGIWRETGLPVTVNQVRARIPPPAGVDPRVLGAVFKPSEWEPDEFVLSDRRECHRRHIRSFRPRQK